MYVGNTVIEPRRPVRELVADKEDSCGDEPVVAAFTVEKDMASFVSEERNDEAESISCEEENDFDER